MAGKIGFEPMVDVKSSLLYVSIYFSPFGEAVKVVSSPHMVRVAGFEPAAF